jgi:nucleoside-diphosphate-sugar epimerase
MHILLAGSTGVIGRQLVPVLTEFGHSVTGLSKSHGVDLFDRNGVLRVVGELQPDVIVHMATAIPRAINPRKIDRDFELTNRLRTEGTHNLVEAAQKVGISQFVAQSLAYAYEPGPGLADETAPFLNEAPRQFKAIVDAVEELERSTLEMGGLALRFGHLHGPGTVYAKDGSFTEQVRQRRVPIVGGGRSVFSFVDVRDAARAVALAIDARASGVLNVVDDEPMQIKEWLPEFAKDVGGPAPKRVPTFVARLLAGGWGAAFMTRLRGASNLRARQLLDWDPIHPFGP